MGSELIRDLPERISKEKKKVLFCTILSMIGCFSLLYLLVNEFGVMASLFLLPQIIAMSVLSPISHCAFLDELFYEIKWLRNSKCTVLTTNTNEN